MQSEIRRAVMDASMLIQTVLMEKHTGTALRLLEALDAIYAPTLVLYEMGNVLVMLARRKLITTEDVARKFDRITSIPTLCTREPPLARAMKIAIEHRITLCDASYLALAAEADLPLVTADRRLCKKAKGTVRILHASEIPT